MTIPITVLTGFLGSGKTTLLNELLRHPALHDALVLVNELGEIPLDHLLVRDVREDVLVLESGCVCCSVRGDLVRVLTTQYIEAAEGRAGKYGRVLVETTGLADPTPIAATLVRNTALQRAYHLSAIVTTVDAVLAPRTFELHDEARKQTALADRIVVTKVDLATDAESARAHARARALNAYAPILGGTRGRVDAAALLAPAPIEARITRHVPADEPHDIGHAHRHSNEHADVASFSVRVEPPVDFRAFALWLSVLTQINGDRLLRVKGILRVRDDDAPVVVQSVQHVVYPTYTMAAWPSSDRSSRLVVIARGLDSEMLGQIRTSLLAALEGHEAAR